MTWGAVSTSLCTFKMTRAVVKIEVLLPNRSTLTNQSISYSVESSTYRIDFLETRYTATPYTLSNAVLMITLSQFGGCQCLFQIDWLPCLSEMARLFSSIFVLSYKISFRFFFSVPVMYLIPIRFLCIQWQREWRVERESFVVLFFLPLLPQ